MGCDIHTRVEYKRGGRWNLLDGPWLCYFCDGEGPMFTRRHGRECYFCGGTGRVNNPWHVRNYSVFGMLAGVRSDAWRVMSVDRGLPRDLSFDPETTDDDGSWLGDHSYGFVTLDDLHAYDWFQVAETDGCVGMGAFAKWDRITPPLYYCGGVSGGLIKHLTIAEADAWLKHNPAPELHTEPFDPSNLYVDDCKWLVSASYCAGNFLTFVGEMTSHARRLNVSNDSMRLVFGFDS